VGVASGALAARVADVQIILVPVSVVSLAVAHYLAYQKGAGGRGQRVALWVATPVSIALWVLPHVMG
jgi:hypothetical protein